MNKFDEKLAQYVEDAKKIGIAIDENLLKLVTKGLGPSIYSKDASTVAGTDQTELDRLKNNFLIKINEKLIKTEGEIQFFLMFLVCYYLSIVCLFCELLCT